MFLSKILGICILLIPKIECNCTLAWHSYVYLRLVAMWRGLTTEFYFTSTVLGMPMCTCVCMCARVRVVQCGFTLNWRELASMLLRITIYPFQIMVFLTFISSKSFRFCRSKILAFSIYLKSQTIKQILSVI